MRAVVPSAKVPGGLEGVPGQEAKPRPVTHHSEQAGFVPLLPATPLSPHVKEWALYGS